MKEKSFGRDIDSIVSFQENKIISFDKSDSSSYSFRFYKDGYVGIYYHQGEISDDIGFTKAEKNLELKRPYKFSLETGTRHRDLTEREISDTELMNTATEALAHIQEKHPNFIFSGSFQSHISYNTMNNDNGLDYSNKDGYVSVSVRFKHKDSKNISDGYYSMSLRNFEVQKFYDMTDNYLTNYNNMLELPDELIIQNQYYGYLGKLRASLDAESLHLGTSLFSGKIGEKLFNENFSVRHDASDKEAWDYLFYDGEGVVLPGDKLPYIENGVLLRGYADKRTADKFNTEHTGSAYHDYSDIPSNGRINLVINRSEKTIKELLNGRLSIIPINSSGGGFNEKGDFVMPVQNSLLCDGEKILGRLPEFTYSTNLYEMFGDGFIGVGCDQPVFNDKSILFKVHKGK